jgi:mannose-1-phosphate guanylyltransferase/mannose-6-phosphate isomerase
MLYDAVHRLEQAVDELVISTSGILTQAITQAGVVDPKNVFGEPARRGTLGALVWTVASLIARGHDEATVAVVTADHAIGDEERFRTAATAAMHVAETVGGIVTLGIRPTRPETGYGYIEMEIHTAFQAPGNVTAYRSQAFREKPNAVIAAFYLESGHHLWNSGMFFFCIPEFLREMQTAAPEAHARTLSIVEALKAGDLNQASAEFLKLPDLSVDYAVLEKAEMLHVIPVDFPWDDVGAWDSLDRTMAPDELGNVTKGESHFIDVNSCIVVNDGSERVVALLGLKNLVVVSTAEAVLVCDKAQTQRVKELVALMAKAEEQVEKTEGPKAR